MGRSKELDEKLSRGKSLLAYLREHRQESVFGKENSWLGTEVSLEIQDFSLFQIQELTFEEKAPRREAMENILGTFRGMKGISFIYLILGEATDVNFYFGVAQDYSYDGEVKFNAIDLGEDILAPSIRGNFRGCNIREVSNTEKKAIRKKLQNCKTAGCLFGVPGTVEDNEDFQGVERLVDVMAGNCFGFLLIARPYSDKQVDELERALIAIGDALTPLARYTLQKSHSEATSIHDGKSRARSEQTGKTTQTSDTQSESSTHNITSDKRNDTSNQTQASTSNMASEQSGRNQDISHSHTDEYDRQGSHPKSDSKNWSESNNESTSVQSQIMDAYSYSAMKSESTADSNAKSDSKSHTKQESSSQSYANNESHDSGKSTNDSNTLTEQMEVEGKEASDWIKYIDEFLLPRLDYGRGKGLFLSCAYLFADTQTALHRLGNTAISLYSGPKGNRSALAFHRLDGIDAICLRALQNMQIPLMESKKEEKGQLPLVALSQDLPTNRFFVGNWLSAQELGILAALPQKEVPGLALREEVDFGLNLPATEAKTPPDEQITLGHLVQNGVKTNLPVHLDKRALDKHTFITGVTGSGKTTTCQHILTDWGWGEKGRPFLVIEPAKTEYRILRDKDVIFFTPGQQDVAPFYLNPFELFPGEKITARADMLKATFTAAFDMEAAIPQILETAIYRAYKNKGWDIQTNLWKRRDETAPDGPFADGVYAFPTLSDFLLAIRNVTEEEGFDERLKNDYIGSIKARVESLTVGAKGMMLNTGRSLDFGDLINRHVVIELEEIKSGEEKTLLMGFILTNLLQAIKAKHRENPNFRHITLIEEAHRLLSRYEPGDSMSKKQGVGVFADMLAEVRKYGESLIIADQIPEKMTPEVLKNTNTKIVHKLFAKDDKESIGDAMALDDDQKAFLSKLPTGRAVMLSQGWGKAVQVQVQPITDTSQQEVRPEEIKEVAATYYAEKSVWSRGVLRGSEQTGIKPSVKRAKEYLWLLLHGGTLLHKFQEIVGSEYAPDEQKWQDFIREIEYIKQHVDDALWQTYLYCNTYAEYDADRADICRKMLDDVQKMKTRETDDVIRKYLRLRRA